MTFADYDIEVGNRFTGQTVTICPKCSHERKKKSDKCLSVNIDEGVWLCHHCGWKGSLKKKQYKLPEWTNKTELSNKVVEWFSSRNISQDTLIKMKVTESKEFMPQQGKEMSVICFNYFREGELVNVKYRDGAKNFKLYKDAELIFYNIDGVKDQEEVLIVEGEMDCLTMIQLGFTNCISVPNGANKGNNNLQYFDNCYHYFDSVKSVVIATDMDDPGQRLAEELARRIGVEKCYRANLGEYKDVNEMYSKTGAVTFKQMKPFPIEGIFGVEEHWDGFLSILKNGFPKGWKPRGKIGEKITIHPGYTTIITGIPGHGKSEILDQLLVQLCLDYDLRGGFFTPENRPTELHLLKLIEKLTGKSVWERDMMLMEKAKDFLTDRIFWFYPEEGYDLDSILERVRKAVLRFGINWYVIDPWNKLEHHYTQSETKYISESLDKISNFNHKNKTHAFIVAHPTKMRMNQETGKYDIPGLYDISGSANFYNKADIGLTMYKDDKNMNTLCVQKVKFKYWGEVGTVPLTWNPENGRYDDMGRDLTNWLKSTKETEVINFDEPSPF
jgi:twinkle protein